jgi:hypothetical protein
MADKGEARTDWLRAGDNVRIDVKDLDGQSLFGAIEQSLPDHDGE